jgi:predicted ATP-grasp superfamily ATP-dependent carboligase
MSGGAMRTVTVGQPKSAVRARAVDALVVDAEQRQSLVCVRSLGAAGLKVRAVATRPAPAFKSRWCASAGIVPDVAVDPDAFVDALLDRSRADGNGVIICTHDGSIAAVRRRRGELEERVHVGLANERALGIAVSKQRTLALAGDLGLAVPRGYVIDDAAEIADVAADLGLPLVVKPSASWADEARTRLVGSLCVDLEEARAAVTSINAAAQTAVVQEWLTGSREAISLFRVDGAIKARFAQVAYRMHPPLGGSSVVRESIAPPADIMLAAEELVDAIDLDGYCEVEFRRDDAGEAKLMEINPRLSASVEIAVRSGVDFPLLVYRWASGDRVPTVAPFKVGVRMRWLGGDLSALRESLLRRGRPECPGPWPAISDFVRDFFRSAHYDYLARGDLAPAFAATGAWLADRSRIGRVRAGRPPNITTRRNGCPSKTSPTC